MCRKNKIASAFRSRIVSALKDQSGASLLFVLGVMLMLLAVGASVLAAAFGNFGIGIQQENHNRAMLLGDSIHRNIERSLRPPETLAAFNASLSRQIALLIFNNFDDEPEERRSGMFFVTMDDIKLGVAISDFPEIEDVLRSVTLSFPCDSTVVAIAGPDIEDSLPWTARLSAAMSVTVEVWVDHAGSGRFITFEAVYKYRDGILTEPPGGGPGMDFLEPEHRGSWEMVSFEIIDELGPRELDD